MIVALARGGVTKIVDLSVVHHIGGKRSMELIYQYLVPSRSFKLTPLLRKSNSS